MEGNPIREIRMRLGDTLQSFSKKLNINYQTLYMNELGCYPHILEPISNFLEEQGYEKRELEAQYRDYVFRRRQEFKDKHEPYTLPPVGDLKISPVKTWREYLGYTKSSFCKSLCLQPSQMTRLEGNKTFHLFDQLKQALVDIKFPEDLSVELNYRIEEFFSRTH